ncbi:MAG: DNA-3-methyladenine glycosylase [Spirosomataceae bacterium]
MLVPKLQSDFYQRSTMEVAQLLLGCILVHQSEEGATAGMIVETEAYVQGDPACHAYRRKTERNAPMFGKAGTVYVYQIYGMHYCFNVVTALEGVGEAVLIRALEPIEGLDLMHQRRGTSSNLCKGPANLVKAMGMHKGMNCWSLTESDLFILPAENTNLKIVTTTRIGLTQGADLPYRFYISGNKFVSRK